MGGRLERRAGGGGLTTCGGSKNRGGVGRGRGREGLESVREEEECGGGRRGRR